MSSKGNMTAVEWLIEHLNLDETSPNYNQWVVDQAKQMEKDQIIDSFMQGADIGDMFNNENRAFITDAEQYYNDTFKSE